MNWIHGIRSFVFCIRKWLVQLSADSICFQLLHHPNRLSWLASSLSLLIYPIITSYQHIIANMGPSHDIHVRFPINNSNQAAPYLVDDFQIHAENAVFRMFCNDNYEGPYHTRNAADLFELLYSTRSIHKKRTASMFAIGLPALPALENRQLRILSFLNNHQYSTTSCRMALSNTKIIIAPHISSLLNRIHHSWYPSVSSRSTSCSTGIHLSNHPKTLPYLSTTRINHHAPHHPALPIRKSSTS